MFSKFQWNPVYVYIVKLIVQILDISPCGYTCMFTPRSLANRILVCVRVRADLRVEPVSVNLCSLQFICTC